LEWGEKVIGVVGLSDALRLDAAMAVRELTRQGISVYCLSGDSAAAVSAAAAAAGIRHEFIRSGLTPEAKASFIVGLQSSGQLVIMVGDGINDSPALAAADVGVAIGGGSNIARSTADVVLVRNDLMSVPMLLQLSATTFQIIRLNFFWGFLYNITAIPFASGALYSCCKLYIPLAFAGISELFSSVPVVMFSLLLFRFKYAPEGSEQQQQQQQQQQSSLLTGSLTKLCQRFWGSSSRYSNFEDKL
jgi:Cu+-exporting ATPase